MKTAKGFKKLDTSTKVTLENGIEVTITYDGEKESHTSN